MKIKVIYAKIKDYIEYKKYEFEDLRAMGYISRGEIIFVSIFILFVVSVAIFWVVSSTRAEKEYQRKVQELNRYYRDKQKELNIDRHPLDNRPDISEFNTLEDWIKWNIENDLERPR